MQRWWSVLVVIAAITAAGMAALMALRAAGLIALPGEETADATTLVQRTAQALDSVAVRGTVVTRVLTPQGLISTRADVHRGDGRVVIHYLTGPAQGATIYRAGDAVWVRGAQGVLRRQAELADGWSSDLLERNWRFRTVGRRRVAGRPTIVFAGRGPGGSVIVAADTETAFPLSLERRNAQGDTLSATVWQTADFSVAPPPPPDAPPPPGSNEARGRRTRVTLSEAREAAGFTVLQPAWLPPGFELQAWYLHEGRRGTMVEARATDGLRPLLILQRSASGGDGPAGLSGPPPGRGPGMGMGGGQGRGPGGGMGEGRMMRMRGAGGDAVRRVIGETAVTVIGPIRIEDLERVVGGLQPVS